MRIGIGYDVHRLVRGRRLFLGGFEFENAEFGLEGHSDADVLLHSVMDALLGAAGLRDIGYYFPSNDEKYKNIRSTELLKKVVGMLKDKRYSINNVDAIVVGEYPRVAPHTDKIIGKMAGVMEIDGGRIAIKATTEEGLGFTGAKEGVAVHAAATITENK